MTRRRKFLISGAVVLTALIVGLAVTAVSILRSDWFREKVRARIVTEAEKATGGQAEVGSFSFDWRSLRAEVGDFVLRESEPAGGEPFFRADQIAVRITIVSIFRRDVDVALIEIVRPSIQIVKREDGTTNIPRRQPPAGQRRDLVTPILKLAVREFRVVDGFWRYGAESGSFDFQGRDLQTEATYAAPPPGYNLSVSWRQMIVRSPNAPPANFDADLRLRFEQDLLKVSVARFTTPDSTIEADGEMQLRDAKELGLNVSANVGMRDVIGPLRLPIEPVGTTRFQGTVRWIPGQPFLVQGRTEAQGLAVRTSRVFFNGIRGSGQVTATPQEITVENLRASTLDGVFRGSARIREFREFEVKGSLNGLTLHRVLPRVRVDGIAWNGALSGPVEVAGSFAGPVHGRGRMTIVPAKTGLPLEGSVDATFDTEVSDVFFETARLTTGLSRVDVAGSLRKGLQLSVFSENIPDLLPGFAAFGAEAPDPFPVRLDRGTLQFAGLLSGVFEEPVLAGHVAAGPVIFEGRRIESVAADFDLAEARLRLRTATVRQEKTAVRGDLELSLTQWRASDASTLTGEFRMERGSLDQLLSTYGRDLPMHGEVDAIGRLRGTVADPDVFVHIRARDLVAYEESVDAIQADLHYTRRGLSMENGSLRSGAGELRVKGAYTGGGSDWQNGELSFDVSADRFRLKQWKAVRDFRENLDAAIAARFSGTLRLQDGNPRLSVLDGSASATGLTLGDRSIGDVQLSTSTQRNFLIAEASAAVGTAVIRANAQWNLARESFGLGEVQFKDLTLSGLQDLGLFGGPETNLRMAGSFDGDIAFVGPILRPSDWRGLAKVTRVELSPRSGDGRADPNLTMRNDGALAFEIEPAKITIQSARLVSGDADLTLSGTLSYLQRNPWNLEMKGAVSLAILTAFRDDLEAKGRSKVDAVIRGSLMQPQINGRIDFENGSFYLRNLPNGLDQVNGSILFNRSRATFENVTSRTGGGKLDLSGFIGFGGEEWVYRLRAEADQVRVRYPEGTSTVIDAELGLTGTSTRSLLAGQVRVTRMSFAPAASDFGSLLSDTATVRPITEVSNPFLRGMQFDAHVISAPNAEIITSLARDIEVEADLRLRGTVARPVLLGRIGVNRGEIQFFGNQYNIVQGEITFFNPAKIEPVLAMDLETRVRSYTVMMNFSGPLNKLNFSYRSDPPLQSQEIMALLTVGRAPTYAGSPTTSGPADTSYFQAGGGSFLGHALTSPVSSRLQRFFGVSRIKIDPQLTGIDNTPETHVTIEQQISREITLTYVTNLTRTQQQIVRLEWNFHRDWSVFAVRDSNGVFGIDFVYRRRFR